MASGIIMVTGGARSGKSRFAQDLARELGGRTVYIATAGAEDDEMAQRIAKHQAGRPETWETIEVPLALTDAIRSCRGKADTVIVDCLALFVNNLIGEKMGPLGENDNPYMDPAMEDYIAAEITNIVRAAAEVSGVVIFVTNEVGQGLAPPYHLGRFFRDALGRANQTVAAAADKVFVLHCGVAVELKSLSVSPGQAAGSI